MTTWWGWLTRRAAASRGLIFALFLLLAATSGIIAGSFGHSELTATTAARQTFALADPDAAGLRLQARLGPDPAAQDRLARNRLAEGFAPVPVQVWTTTTTEPRPVTTPKGSYRVSVWAGAHLSAPALRLESGQWPSPGSRTGVIHAAAAKSIGIGVGGVIKFGGQAVEIVGTWLPTQPADPSWFGDPLVLSGGDGDVVGPLVVPDQLLGSLAPDPFIRWSVTPDLDVLSAADLPRLAAGATRAAELAAGADVTGRGVTSIGNLAPTAAQATAEWESARAISLVPLSLLALIAFVGLVYVAGVLADARQFEDHLLLARGASPSQVFTGGALESVLLALFGCGSGTALAVLVLRLISGGSGQTRAVIIAGVTTLGLALGALLMVALERSRRLTAGPSVTGNRMRAVAGIGLLLLTGALAGLSLWQLRRADAVVNVGSDGRVRLNLLAALAPTLGLAALAIVGLILLAPALRLLEQAQHGGTGAVGFLAAAQSARAMAINAVVVVLTILATGSIAIASIFWATASSLDRDLGLLTKGAPLRVQLGAEPPSEGASRLPKIGSIEGTGNATPVWLDPAARVGDTTVTALVADPQGLRESALAPLDSRLPAELMQQAQPGARPIALQSGSTGIDISFAGQIVMNPWQHQELQLLPELSEAAARIEQAGNPNAPSLEDRMAQELEARREAVEVELQFLVRDRRTQFSSRLAGPSLLLPGPSITWAGDQASIGWKSSSGSASAHLELPYQGDWVIDAVSFKTTASAFTAASQDLELSLGITVAGQPVLGASTSDWLSDRAIPAHLTAPYDAAREEAGQPKVTLKTIKVSGQDRLTTSSNQPPRTATAELSGPRWRIRGTSTELSTLLVGPNVRFSGSDPLGAMRANPKPPPVVPVVITSPLAEAASLAVGDSFELLTLSRRVPASVAAITDAVVGTSTPAAVLVPAEPLAVRLAGLGQTLPWPHEIWVQANDPDSAASSIQLLAGVQGVTVAKLGYSAAGASRIRLDFAVAAGAAAVLALVGIAAAVATQATQRRREVSVLRALGMTPREQAWSRVLELTTSIALAVLLGVSAGWVMSWAVVAQVARSGSKGLPRLTIPLQVNLPLLFGQVGSFLILAAALVAIAGAQVHRQAGQAGYREEVT